MLEEPCKRIQHCCAMLQRSRNKRNVGSCWPGFKLCATTRNNMQQGVQTDATCNIQQCWELLANSVASVCTGPYGGNSAYIRLKLHVLHGNEVGTATKTNRKTIIMNGFLFLCCWHIVICELFCLVWTSLAFKRYCFFTEHLELVNGFNSRILNRSTLSRRWIPLH